VLALLCRTLAPLLPLTTEAVYRAITGERSVHLTDWPDVTTIPSDPDLVESMDLARDVCSSTLRLRKAHQRRVRQPLARLTVAAPGADRLRPFLDLIADEVNVKVVELSDDVAAVASHDLQVTPAALGPRLGPLTQQVIKAVKSGDWQRTGDTVTAGGIELLEGEYSLKLVVVGEGASTPLPRGAGVVLLDTDLTPELEAEGLTRDLVRLVQQARRDAGLNVSDRITVTLGAAVGVRERITPFLALLTDATLATTVVWEGAPTEGVPGTADLDGHPVTIAVVAV
jgi:isoleucyl-tRNA synthetase